VTPRAVREHNVFHWAPIVEVAKIFAGIFITIIPVIAMLGAGRDGALAGVVSLVVDPDGKPLDTMVFWTTGVLSAFLDNAPTYLVFFNLAGGDAAALMGPLKATLVAISMGAVYFGALTYVGNAPNFMIKAIAEDRGIAMPSFFGYFSWASLIIAAAGRDFDGVAPLKVAEPLPQFERSESVPRPIRRAAPRELAGTRRRRARLRISSRPPGRRRSARSHAAMERDARVVGQVIPRRHCRNLSPRDSQQPQIGVRPMPRRCWCGLT
jgi:hypothetical protein